MPSLCNCPFKIRQLLPLITIYKLHFTYFRIKTIPTNMNSIHKHFHLNLVDFLSKDKLSSVSMLNH